MKILSIHDGHNASAAVFDQGKLLSAVSEERINRIKFFIGWPKLSIKEVLKENNLSLKDIDVVTISHLGTWSYLKRKKAIGDLKFKSLRHLYGVIHNTAVMAYRELFIRAYFLGSGRRKIYFCDHHLAHAASAYYFSGFDEALAVTIDWLGDSLSHTAYSVKDGSWELVCQGDSNESLGAFYAALTEGLGFKPNRHEGKIVGLAAMGDYKKIEAKIGDWFVSISDDRLHFKRQPYRRMIEKVRELGAEFSREDIAAYGQNLLEKLVVAHVQELCGITGAKNLTLAGGVFANVKLNQKLVEQCPIDKIFIQPAMGDEGLVLGSAAYYLGRTKRVKINSAIDNVYLGGGYSDEYVEALLEREGFTISAPDNIPALAADLLNRGKIVGWFDGRMEFGPRALGHRTMMADPRKKEINQILNKRLRRSEFMPFAPSVLYEHADEVFENVAPSKHPAEFMTITYQVKPAWSERIGAVVHVDNTARPQLVKKEKNESFYNVIAAYHKLTGIPLIINTSFNMHEEPIVCSPEDALRAFKEGAVDHLIFNDKYLISTEHEN